MSGKQFYNGSNREKVFHRPIWRSCVLPCKNGHREVQTKTTERESMLLWMSSFYNQSSTAEHSFKSQFNICNSDSCKLIWAWRKEQLIDKTGVFTSALKCGIWFGKKAPKPIKNRSVFIPCQQKRQ